MAATAKIELARCFAGMAGAAAGEEGPTASSYAYQSQRVPGARALAPFLQAVTAFQQMRVSHEVCRVMTAGVKVRYFLWAVLFSPTVCVLGWRSFVGTVSRRLRF